MISAHQTHPQHMIFFKRFANVFEQTYTRFLDFQKAEAQSREAQIEASIGKSESSNNGHAKKRRVPEAASLLFQQVKVIWE